ncbi:hypothetical protein [Cloacibacillus sp. An23]|uniref:hypothetical protein n=1 Tax=Cloacibacillus sp. An23 TaxID=1965591 RepID=UPI000B36C0A9|nr:hypothetical protein [Cloacibacillus sp. An23]OUO90109.1 hypothetical protein B5F39_13870 [Cloacibacillus sp. An23]
MFKIKLNPQVNDLPSPVVSVQGDVITINGEDFDFSQLAEGDELINQEEYRYTVDENGAEHMELVTPKSIASDYIDGNVKCAGGYIELSLILPLLPNSPLSACFPSPRVLVMDTDGPVILPDTTPEAPTEENEAQTNER